MATFTYLARLTGAGNPTTLTFSSIPNTYQDLVIFGNINANASASTSYQSYISFNAVSGTSHRSMRWGTTDTTSFTGNGGGAGSDSFSYLFSSGTNYANRFTQMQMYIPQYAAGSNVRSMMGWQQFMGNTTGNYLLNNNHNGLFNTSTAISSIIFTQSSGWATGTVLTLYGITKS